MKTLKCAFAGLRLVPFGASAMARQRYSRRQNEIIVPFVPAGPTAAFARDASVSRRSPIRSRILPPASKHNRRMGGDDRSYKIQK